MGPLPSFAEPPGLSRGIPGEYTSHRGLDGHVGHEVPRGEISSLHDLGSLRKSAAIDPVQIDEVGSHAAPNLIRK
jgi:hypothetical protein